MKKGICIVVLVVLVLAGGMLLQGLHREEALPQGGSGAALGLMLLEKEPPLGLYVLAVTQESPADKAGIHPGDYLLKSGDTPLQTAAQLDAMIDAAADVLPLTLGRDGQQLQVRLPTR